MIEFEDGLPEGQSLPDGEPFPDRAYLAEGWSFVNPDAAFTPDAWAAMLVVIGADDHRLLGMSIQTVGGGRVHGCFLMSPAGLARFKALGIPADIRSRKQ